ncbi:hypothetical protein Hanom_Chr06g00579001 [Helianthus anomalus]
MKPTYRLPVTFLSHYFNRIRHCSSSIRSVDLDRAAAPIDGCDYKLLTVIYKP